MNTTDTAEPALSTSPLACAPRAYAGFPRLATRRQANSVGQNHHIYDNNGTWFIHYTVHPDPFTKQRVRTSLRTNCVHEARRRRDVILAQLSGGEVILRRFAHLTAA